MHHDTDCIGCIRVTPPLNEEEIDALLDLADSGTLRGTPTGRGNSDVPFARASWDVCQDGCCLWWDGYEEDQWIGPTLEFLVDHWFRAGAVGQGHPKLEAFTFDHVLDGLMAVRGHRSSTLVEVSTNVVTWRRAEEPCEMFEMQPGYQPSPQSCAELSKSKPAAKATAANTRPLPANVIELRPRRANGGGGAAG